MILHILLATMMDFLAEILKMRPCAACFEVVYYAILLLGLSSKLGFVLSVCLLTASLADGHTADSPPPRLAAGARNDPPWHKRTTDHHRIASGDHHLRQLRKADAQLEVGAAGGHYRYENDKFSFSFAKGTEI